MYFLLVAPLTIPTIAIAISIYGVALHLHLIGNLAAFVLANSLITAPLVALFVAAATLNVDRRLEYASLSCGAGPIRTLARITVPLVLPTAVAGGGLAFLLTLDEVVISSFLVGPGRTPLAVKLFLHIQTGSTPITTAAATFLILLSIVIVSVLSVFRTLAARSRVAVTAELGAQRGKLSSCSCVSRVIARRISSQIPARGPAATISSVSCRGATPQMIRKRLTW